MATSELQQAINISPTQLRTSRQKTSSEWNRVSTELQEFVRAQLRSTKTPEQIRFVAELPYNETGKLLRRVLRDEFAAV